MTTLAAIEDAFGTYIAASLPVGSRVLVRGNIGESPAPSSPYVIYRLAVTKHPEFTRTEYTSTDQIVRANTTVEFAVSVVGNRSGSTAMDDATRIALGLRLTQRTGDLYALCGLWGVEPVQDLSGVEVGTMRTRADFRVSLSVSTDITAPREWIAEVETTVTEPVRTFDKSIIVEAP